MGENVNTGSARSKADVIKSLVWKLAERCGVQLSSFVISIVLARLIEPEEYGVLTILLIFITISQVIVQSGMGTALIQKESVDDGEYRAVFWVNLIIAAVTYTFLFFTAPLFSEFFRLPALTQTLRVLALVLFSGAFTTVLNARLVKDLRFSRLFVCNIIGGVISGVIGIALALNGFGVWALVFQHLLNQVIASVMMVLVLRWIPVGRTSLKKVLPLIKYGYKVMLANLLSTTYNELRSLAIGKKYDSAVLAFYDKGKQFPQTIINNVSTAIDNVMLPVYSSAQKEPEKLKGMLRRSMKMSSFIVFPAMIGLCAVAEPLVSILLTDKWLPCVPFLRINALIYALSPLQTANGQSINAIGRSDIFLKLEIIKKTFGVAILAFTLLAFDDVLYIAYGGLVIAVLSSAINMFPNTKLLSYSYAEQLKDILPSLLISAVMGVAVWSLELVLHNNWILIFVQACAGVVIYLVLAFITRNDSLKYLINTVKGFVGKKRKIQTQ